MPRKTIARPLPSVEYLHECFRYNPETGVLTWRDRPREHFACAYGAAKFNSRCAGRAVTAGTNRGYTVVRVAYQLYPAHRICWALHYGWWPTQHIDHINGIPKDNRIVNLRDVTSAENHHNMVKFSNNRSGHTGVYWNNNAKKWHARVMVNRRAYHLGYYDDLDDAVAARQRANEQFGFSPRHGQDMVQLPDS